MGIRSYIARWKSRRAAGAYAANLQREREKAAYADAKEKGSIARAKAAGFSTGRYRFGERSVGKIKGGFGRRIIKSVVSFPKLNRRRKSISRRRFPVRVYPQTGANSGERLSFDITQLFGNRGENEKKEYRDSLSFDINRL